MLDPRIVAPWPLDGDVTNQPDLASQRERVEYAARCAARHLVVAAVELARDPDLPPDRAARFSLAESKFRALTDFDGISNGSVAAAASPSVPLPDGSRVAMTDLLMGACQLLHFRLPHRSIDSELVYAAKELLSGLSWQFPDEQDDTPRPGRRAEVGPTVTSSAPA